MRIRLQFNHKSISYVQFSKRTTNSHRFFVYDLQKGWLSNKYGHFFSHQWKSQVISKNSFTFNRLLTYRNRPQSAVPTAESSICYRLTRIDLIQLFHYCIISGKGPLKCSSLAIFCISRWAISDGSVLHLYFALFRFKVSKIKSLSEILSENIR